jgi:hypothetical protein
MGGSGGSGFQTSRSADQLREEVRRDLEQAKLQSEVNAFLTEQLAAINNRDVDLVSQRLDEITEALGDGAVDVDKLLFGGSVAKHTYVDGLSDIDALVVIKGDLLEQDSPQALREATETSLRGGLDMSKVTNIEAGFAVTVTYHDGTQVQLLPAVARGNDVAISDKAGTGWSLIRPKAFEERLTAANREQGGRLVPAVKLAKAIVDARLTDRDSPGGYHMEALAVDAFRGYNGPRDNRSMLTHFFNHAAERIKTPIADITGQSERIDEVFGAANSQGRLRVSAALGSIGARIGSASTVEQWQAIFAE